MASGDIGKAANAAFGRGSQTVAIYLTVRGTPPPLFTMCTCALSLCTRIHYSGSQPTFRAAQSSLRIAANKQMYFRLREDLHPLPHGLLLQGRLP
jgi:hypothetical protein